MQSTGVSWLAVPSCCSKMVMMMVVVVAVICSSRVAVVDAQVKLLPGTKLLNAKDSAKYADCGDLHKAGYNISGVHRLHNFMNKTESFLIWCEFTKDNAATVIQQRTDGNVDFVKPLDDYVRGFGYPSTSYWAGLNAINYLTQIQGNQVLTVTLRDWAGYQKRGQYRTFIVQSNADRYRMVAGTYSSRDGLLDDLSFSSGFTFQTYDYPDVHNCAIYMKAGWWYNYCAYTLLNGHYYIGGPYKPSGSYYDGIFWKDWGNYGYSFKFVQMAVSHF